MKDKRFSFLVWALCVAANCLAQTEGGPDQWGYRVEMAGSAASGRYTPLWLVSNRYGLMPLAAGNGYMSAGASYAQSLGKGLRWEAALDMALAAPRYRLAFVRQLYAGLSYGAFALRIGSKEETPSLWDKALSSGDMVWSANARPIPGLQLSVPRFTLVPGMGGWLSLKGNFSLGRSFDNDYLSSFANSEQTYIRSVRWHHKSLFFRLASPDERSPWAFILGVQHGAQWGGTSTDPAIGRQPGGVMDFIRVVMGQAGGEDASMMDKVNVLGNQYGSYDFKLSYTSGKWALHAYHQRYFEDKSGTIFGNGKDGLWGLQLDLPRFPWLQKILVEHLDTRHQSGPFHFIDFDHEKHPGIGGGADRYYDHEEYTTGLSYFNRSIGTPLLPSPEYNTGGELGFKNNRVRDWHLGVSGSLSPHLAYRLLLTLMDSWGTPYRPFLENKTGTATLLELTYNPPGLKGWTVTGSVAADGGTIFGKGTGLGIGIAKREILPTKPKR
jgi:hypothetical protein